MGASEGDWHTPQSEGQVAHHGHPISTTHGWGETDKAGIGGALGLKKTER